MCARLLWGGPTRKNSAESPELDFTPFPCPALIRDFCGGSHKKKKVGGVTGIGLHAVSMSRLYDGHPRTKEEAIKITVPYQSVPAGHEMQVGKLKLYEEDRRNLAALLKVGMPYTNSIENIQKKCPPTERLGLLTKKDLHNVSRDFEVDESILHAEDAVSVDLQNKKKSAESPELDFTPFLPSLKRKR
ncbi:uncharacterized protein TNCV_1876081 [Trichonephila clavipes]|nr:uncharacterized protein TNCV_1876081 [Trichonephila clavipes]